MSIDHQILRRLVARHIADDDVIRLIECARRTVPVGSKPKGVSPYGALDMAGNVWEWTADWYQPYLGSTYQSEDFGEIFKVTRGGGWSQEADLVTASNRNFTDPIAANDDLGFRCAR